VVFADLAMQPSQYRRYRVEGITPGDDGAALRQVLTKRYAGLAQAWAPATATAPVSPTAASPDTAQPHTPPDKEGLPDIVLIDGGQPQIAAAKAVFQSLGLPIDRLVGVEKGEGRKVGLEELVWADGRSKQSLPAHHPALLFTAHIRDEAHRFAITGMRRQRAKTRQKSRLEDLPGIGPKRRAQLLTHFGGLQAVSQASVQDLLRVPGISHQLAQAIHEALQGSS
jgi:excinuclease ABC subunit C